jgi:nitroreductase
MRTSSNLNLPKPSGAGAANLPRQLTDFDTKRAPFMADSAAMQLLDFERLPEDEMLRRACAFRDSMKRRRTVRNFSSEPVPDGVIEAAIEAAANAPSGANQQPWTFVLIGNPALKRAIRAAAEAEEYATYTRRMSEEWKAALAPLGTDWQKPHLTDAPYLIVVFQQVYGLGAHGEKTKHYYVMESVGIAIGMLLAALHQAGLATLTHTPSPMAFLTELLKRPPNERPMVIIPVGYPAPGATVPAIQRKRLDEVLVRLD